MGISSLFRGRPFTHSKVSDAAGAGGVEVNKFTESTHFIYFVYGLPKVFQKFRGVVESFSAGSFNLKDIVFLESLHYRYYGKTRRSVYPSSAVSSSKYSSSVLPMAVALASCCADKDYVPDVSLFRLSLDFKSLSLKLARYSLKNELSSKAWSSALRELGFRGFDVIGVIPTLSSVDLAVACLHGMVVYRDEYFGIDKFADELCKRAKLLFDVDLVEEYNSRVGSSSTLFISTKSSLISEKILAVSSIGIAFV